jgi:hypothetical protein
MKSAYELAMERLDKSDPSSQKTLNDDQKARLAEIDLVFKGKLAEREIFFQQKLDSAIASGNAEEADQMREQISSEKARLEEVREAEKDRVRNES